MSRIETLRHCKMSQSLKEVDEESLGTVCYNFSMNHNSVHKVPDLRGIFSATCMLLFLRENTLHQSTFALPYTNYLGFISQHKISCKILQHKLKTLTWVETFSSQKSSYIFSVDQKPMFGFLFNALKLQSVIVIN